MRIHVCIQDHWPVSVVVVDNALLRCMSTLAPLVFIQTLIKSSCLRVHSYTVGIQIELFVHRREGGRVGRPDKTQVQRSLINKIKKRPQRWPHSPPNMILAATQKPDNFPRVLGFQQHLPRPVHMYVHVCVWVCECVDLWRTCVCSCVCNNRIWHQISDSYTLVKVSPNIHSQSHVHIIWLAAGVQTLYMVVCVIHVALCLHNIMLSVVTIHVHAHTHTFFTK